MEEVFLETDPPPEDDAEWVERKDEGVGIDLCAGIICCCCKIDKH
jgi:hypothetical protein